MRHLTFALALMYERDRCSKPPNQFLSGMKEEFFGMEPEANFKKRVNRENEQLQQINSELRKKKKQLEKLLNEERSKNKLARGTSKTIMKKRRPFPQVTTEPSPDDSENILSSRQSIANKEG